MEYTLLVPNRWRRCLPWLVPPLFFTCLAVLDSLPAVRFLLLGGFLGAIVIGMVPPLQAWLFWQPLPVWLAADGVAWLPPGAGQPVRCLFAELNAYRFESYSRANTAALLLWPPGGAKQRLYCWDNADFSAFRRTFTQAAQQYNHANPTAPLVEKATLLARFFASRASTTVLLALLGASAVWLGWCVAYGHLSPGAGSMPVLLVAIPYFLAWVATIDERNPPPPVRPAPPIVRHPRWLR